MLGVSERESNSVQNQKALFRYNRKTGLDGRQYADLIRYEEAWIKSLLQPLADCLEPIDSFQAFRERIHAMVERQAESLPPSALFLAHDADRAQFKILVDQFAIDGLTEAQAFLPILPRLPFPVQMPIMRVLIDEFGCGNLERMHSHLYSLLLQELGSPTDLDRFVTDARDEVCEFVNVFHWMSKRAPYVEYFLGALTWFESVVPAFFAPYVQACDRLDIAAHHYFSEHIHIDVFHAQSALLACREGEKHIDSFDYGRALLGAQLIEAITERAFDAAVAAARESRETA
jgi:hypothetical protein